jgi:predicted MFS family arabinose efflux permease
LIYFFLPETLPKQEGSSRRTLASQIRFWNPLNYLLDRSVAAITFGSSVVFSTIYLVSTLQPPLLKESYPSITTQQIGYCGMVIGIGTSIGTVAGGRLADLGFQFYGRGGRLLVPYIVMICLGVSLIAYGFLITRHFWLGVSCSFLIGLFVPSSRPGCFAFAMEEFPQNSGAVIGNALSLPPSLSSFPLTNLPQVRSLPLNSHLVSS